MIRELRLTPRQAYTRPGLRARFRAWRDRNRFKLIVGAALVTAIVWTVAYA